MIFSCVNSFSRKIEKIEKFERTLKRKKLEAYTIKKLSKNYSWYSN